MYDDVIVLGMTRGRNHRLVGDIRIHLLMPRREAVQIRLWKLVKRDARVMVEKLAHVVLGESLRRDVLRMRWREDDDLLARSIQRTVTAVRNGARKRRQHALWRGAATIVDEVQRLR